MTADTAKYPLPLAAIDPKTVEITAFSGIGAISSPYYFDQFRLADASTAAPSDWRGGGAGGHLGRACGYGRAKHINVFKKHILNIGLQGDTGGKIVPTAVLCQTEPKTYIPMRLLPPTDPAWTPSMRGICCILEDIGHL